MYVEAQDDNQNRYWKYLEPSGQETQISITSKEFKQKSYNLIAAGEFLFYFAYKTNFYGNPVSGSFKQFLDKGITGIPLRRLENGGDSTIWHFYNHITSQIECWKHVINKQTKKTDFIRVK